MDINRTIRAVTRKEEGVGRGIQATLGKQSGGVGGWREMQARREKQSAGGTGQKNRERLISLQNLTDS